MSKDAKFRSHHILRTANKGTGAYGAVYKARCDNLLCAAKILHPNLVISFASLDIAPEKIHRLPMMRFESECHFLSTIRHPNIVQYLGTCQDPETRLPVLLMELLDENLTSFLDNSQHTLPFHTQVNICHDISLAISFLHSNGIIHRDLSSNNVLMIGDRRAKVTDFGMATMFSCGDSTLTENPGTEFYMPPEALGDHPQYSASMDCFSYGVLILQVLTLLYPKPGSKYVPVQGGKDLHTKVSEVQRRESHIELVEPDHPLLLLALECLRDEEGGRPPAKMLCTTVEEMRELSLYLESERESDPARKIRELKEELKTAKQRHGEEVLSLKQNHSEELKSMEEGRQKEVHNLQESHAQKMKEIEVFHLREVEDFQHAIKSAEEDTKFLQHNHHHDIMELKQGHTLHVKSVDEEKEEWRQRYRYDMKEKDEELKKLKKRIQELEEGAVEIKANETEGEKINGGGDDSKKNDIIITWKQIEQPAPQSLYRGDSDAVFCNETLYINPGYKRSVFAYNPNLDAWSEMPKCPHEHSTLAHVNSTVLAIGGRTEKLEYLNKIYYLTDEGGECRWETTICMPSKRCSVMAVNIGSSLVVAGGEGESSRLRKVEVMDIKTCTWSTAASFPDPLIFSSATICKGKIYFLGGEVGYNGVEKNLMFTCSVDNLLGSCTKISRKQKLSEQPVNVWHKVVGPPVTQSACVLFQGRILSVGGRGEDRKPTSAVYEYCAETGMWKVVTYMSMTRSKCFAIVLPGEKVLVMGGNTTSGKTDTLEIGLCTLLL